MILLRGYPCFPGISQRGNNYNIGRGRGMQKKLKRKDRGRGRGSNKGSDGFHEVPAIPVVIPISASPVLQKGADKRWIFFPGWQTSEEVG